MEQGVPRASRFVHNGRRLVIFYFVVAYAWPWVGNVLLGDQLLSPFRRAPLTPYAVGLVAGTFLLYTLFSRSVFLVPRRAPSRPKMSRWLATAGRTYSRYRLVTALAALWLSSMYYATGLNSFRYSVLPLSEVGSPLLFVTNLVMTAVGIDLFVMMFMRDPADARPPRRVIEDLIFSVSYLFAANGAMAIVVGLSALLCSLGPKSFGSIVFSTRNLFSLSSARRLGRATVTIVFLFATGWLTNEGIKAASGGKADIVDAAVGTAHRIVAMEGWVSQYVDYITVRTSVYYYSLLFSADDPDDVAAVAELTPALLPLRNLAFRADFVLGKPFGIPRPEVTSMRRLNWLVLAENPAILPRAGASPGLIASFNYAIPLPLNIAFCALYLAWFARVVDLTLWRRGAQGVSLFGLFLLFIFWENFLQSPFDLMLIIDTAFLHVAAMYTLYRMERARWLVQAGRQSAAVPSPGRPGPLEEPMTGRYRPVTL